MQFEITNKINGFKHISYGMALIFFQNHSTGEPKRIRTV
jgi:hypothetical protein